MDFVQRLRPASTTYTKRIVCLANSKRPGGRCIAGRETAGGNYLGWVRPVGQGVGDEIIDRDCRYQNYQYPRVLDIIDIPLAAHVPHEHQTENHRIDPNQSWRKAGALLLDQLDALIERPATLWGTGDSTGVGMNNRVAPALAVAAGRSLWLIAPGEVVIQVKPSRQNPARRRALAQFRYNGIGYRMVVTDPLTEADFLYIEPADHPLRDVLLCLSLTRPYEGDGRCHKLVTTVIHRNPR